MPNTRKPDSEAIPGLVASGIQHTVRWVSEFCRFHASNFQTGQWERDNAETKVGRPFVHGDLAIGLPAFVWSYSSPRGQRTVL